MAYAGAPLRPTLPSQASPRARVAQGLAGPPAMAGGMQPMPGAQPFGQMVSSQTPAQTGMAMGGQPSQSPFGTQVNALQGQYGLGQMGGGMPFGVVPQTPGLIDPFNRFRGGGGFY